MGKFAWFVTVSLLAPAAIAGCHDAASKLSSAAAPEGAPLAFDSSETIQADFGRIRDVAVATDGRVFVADALRPSIWCFDSLGHFVGRLGRKGRGPGEFQSVLSLAVRRHRLFALDDASERITSFALDSWIDGVPADTAPETFSALDFFGPASGDIRRAATGEISATPKGDLLVEMVGSVVYYDTVSSAPMVVRLYSPTGTILRDSLMTIPRDEWLVLRDGGGYSASPMPFGKRSILRVGPDGRIYHLWTGNTFVRVFNPDGSQSRTLTISGLYSRPITSEDLKVMRASIVGSGTSVVQRLMGKQFDKGVEAQAIPDSMPTTSSFVVGDHGALWLTPVTSSDEELSTSAGMVFRPRTGRTEVLMLDPRTGVTRRGNVPLNGRLEAVVANRLYFVTWDSLDVESLRVFDLVNR